jgi:hypothetical protein
VARAGRSDAVVPLCSERTSDAHLTTVYARSKDEAIARRALDGAKQTYYDISGCQVEIDLDASLSNDL